MHRAAIALALAASACTVGPNYTRPVVNLPDAYRGSAPPAATAADQPSIGDQEWWQLFQDEQLQKLIRTALRQNFDVRIAAARVAEARAQLGITRADQFPQLDASALAERERVSASPVPFPLQEYERNVFQVAGSASWEVDFWGRFRRATEAARATLAATEWGRRAVVTSLVAQVAEAYFRLRAIDFNLDIARQTLASRQESLRLTRVRASGGASSELDVRQAEQLVFGASATIVDLERQAEQQENLISLLLGNDPAAVPRGRTLTDQPLIPEVPTGLPSALLEHRPDIVEAEQTVVAANANIGVARANYLPELSLTGSGGLQSAALSSLLTGPAAFFTAGASLIQPVFTAGRTRSQVELAKARHEEALLAYQQTILQSLRDVSDALIAYRRDREFREQQQLLTRSAGDALR
ncbi:MAG TPA: efflux transporter outer membrane subunit, partial [Vicinamibacterales bacterium]|nr:efflux transporter outer membrane subunit [Vicinamibacterales bacterium]